MINPILEFSVRQRLLVLLATAILIGFGILALRKIPIDAFPDVTNVQVQVLVTAGGMSPPEVEKLVTRPIEIELGGLPRLTEIRSVSKIGLSAITVVFQDGVNDRSPRALAKFFSIRLPVKTKSTTRPSYAQFKITSFVQSCAPCPA